MWQQKFYAAALPQPRRLGWLGRAVAIIAIAACLFPPVSEADTFAEKRTFGCDRQSREIEFSAVCDGEADCVDKTDEEHCYYDTCALPESKVFRCQDLLECVLSAYECDGHNDCSDGSDETGCVTSCPGFACANKRDCLPSGFRCDGHPECADGSDEKNCPASHTARGRDACRGHLLCGDGSCVTDASTICDGKPDCASGADEDPLMCSRAVDCARCAQTCIRHQRGTACTCHEGFKLTSNGTGCEDLDECAQAATNPCSHICANTQGSFTCSCLPGYTLINGTSCQSSSDPVYLWYRTHNDSDAEISLQSGSRVRKFNLAPLVSDDRMFWIHKPPMALDVEREELYVRRGETLFRIDTRNSKLTPRRLLPPHVHVKDFAVDYQTRNVYLSDARNSKAIMVCGGAADGQKMECVQVIPDRPHPVSKLTIARLAKRAPRLFWKEAPATIMSSNLDGSDIRQEFQLDRSVAGNGGGGLRGFAVDEASNKLYVVNHDIVEVDLAFRSRQEGSSGRIRKLNTFASAGLFNEVFWTVDVVDDQLLVQVLRVHNISTLLANVADFRVYTYNRLNGQHTGQLTKPASLQLHSVRRRSFLDSSSSSSTSSSVVSLQAGNPCWNDPCSHVCVPRISRRRQAVLPVCLCPPGMTLGGEDDVNDGSDVDDERICVPRPGIEQLFYVNGSVFSSYVYARNVLYRHLTIDLHAVPTAITSTTDVDKAATDTQQDSRLRKPTSTKPSSSAATLFFATRRGLFGVSTADGSRRELARQHRLNSVRAMAFDSVDELLYVANGNDLLAVSADGSGQTALVKQNVDIEHLDIDVHNRTLYLESGKGRLYSMQLGEWSGLVDLAVDVRGPSTAGSQRKWSFDPFERIIRMDASVVLTEGFCDLVHHSEKGFDCELHARWLERCDDPGHRVGMLARSGLRQQSRVESACSATSTSSPCPGLCVTTAENRPVCLCPFGHALAADGKTCSAECGAGLMRCAGDGKCVHQSARCDGHRDCDDGSDETNCQAHRCGQGHFQCKHDGVCIDAKFQCDGQLDCHDGSDEAGCAARNCSSQNEFRCEDGRCLPMRMRCDGAADCFHGDDERDCPTAPANKCMPHEFRCHNGRCIPSEWQCDGSPDCTDGSDEQECKTMSETRKELEKALFGSVECDPKKYVCCDSGKRLSLNFRCDGFPDCDDLSDEEGCGRLECVAPLFQCHGPQGACLLAEEVCDGLAQCPGGEDEAECRGRCYQKKLFECADTGRCLPAALRCDGRSDCADASDERDCPSAAAASTNQSATTACFADEYRCAAGGQCIPMHELCDGRPQCQDGSDEGDHCGLHECLRNNGGCAQLCQETPEGVRCGCTAGYRLMANQVSCEDVDECAEDPTACSHFCHNLKGNFSCSCAPGYLMTPQGSCKVEHGRPVLLSVEHGVLEVVESGSKRALLVSPRSSAPLGGIAYDYGGGLVFVSEPAENKVHRISLYDSDHQVYTIVRPGPLAVDWVTENVYFADATPFIHVCTRLMAGTYCTNVTDTFVNSTTKGLEPGIVTSIALVPDEGLMFYAEERTGRIVRLSMDGSDKRWLVEWPLGSRSPQSLTVDLVHRSLYWLDLRSGSIEFSDFQGQRVTSVVKHLQFVHTFAIFEDYIWFPDAEHSTWVAAHKLSGLIKSSTHSSLGRATQVQVMHAVHQPPAELNRCHSHPCQQICLQRPHGFTCACASGFRAAPNDARQCEPIPHHEDRQDEQDYKQDSLARQLVLQCDCQNGGKCFARKFSDNNGAGGGAGQQQASFYCRCPAGFRGPRCEEGASDGVLVNVLLVCVLCFLIAVTGIVLILIRAQSQHNLSLNKGGAVRILSEFGSRDNESLLQEIEEEDEDENN